MTSKTGGVVVLDDDELEDGEIEDDLEEFIQYERLFQTSDSSAESRKLTSKSQSAKLKRSNLNYGNANNSSNAGGGKREKNRVRNRSHSSRASHRRESRSKSPPSILKSHTGAATASTSSRKKTSPVSLSTKRSHSSSSNRRRVSSSGSAVAKGLKQRAESRLRRRKRDDSPPKPTMRYLLDQRHPASSSSSSSKKRRESEMEEYEELLQKHREIQEAIRKAKSSISTGPDSTESGRRRGQRSRSRSGTKTNLQRKDEHAVKKNADVVAELAVDDSSDDEMDELQLRMLALQSATRAVAAREEKENQEQLLMEADSETALNIKRQEERKQKLAKWKQQHTLIVEMNKATDEKSRYQLFMEHMTRGGSAGNQKPGTKPASQNGQHVASTLHTTGPAPEVDPDSDSDVQEIPITPPVVKETIIVETEDDNYEAVEMELDTEESCFTPPIPGVSDGADITMPLMKDGTGEVPSSHTTTSSSSQPPPPGVSPVKYLPSSQHHQQDETKGEAEDEDEEDEEEVNALRQLLLQSMEAKKAAKKQQEKGQAESKAATSQQSSLTSDDLTHPTANKRQESSDVSSGTSSPVITNALKQLRQAAATAKSKPKTKPKIPVHKPVIIRPGDDSDDSDDERSTPGDTRSAGLSSLDMFLKQARMTADKAKSSAFSSNSSNQSKDSKKEPTTPEAMNKLPDCHRAEYQRLKQEIMKREQKKQSSSQPGSGTASPDRAMHAKLTSKGVQATMKTASKSATSSPDRTENQQLMPSKKAAEKERPLNTNAVSSKDVAMVKGQKDKEALAREQTRKKEIKMSTEKMLKHRQAIEKGYKLLRSLDIQVDRKGKIVELMQVRIKKLRGELLAAQKLVDVHHDQVQKFEEQKQQVRNRLEKHVKEEKQLGLKLAAIKGGSVNDINQSAGSSQTKVNGTKSVIGAKRPLEPSTSASSANKKSKLQSTPTSSPSKPKPKSDPKLQELQRLERAYAQKIEQLKINQAKKAQVAMAHLSPAAARLMKTRKCVPNVKPAKQVYLKDKIALGSSSGNSSGEESGGGQKKRRKSWLDGSHPALTPNLIRKGQGMISKTSGMLPKKLNSRRTSKESLDKNSTSRSKTAGSGGVGGNKKREQKSSKAPPESILEGLYMPSTQQLKLLQQIQAEKSQRGIDFVALAQSFDVYQNEVANEDGFVLRNTTQDRRKEEGKEEEENVVPLSSYTSPLIPFKAYRLCAHFETGSRMTRHSSTVSNKIHPMRPFCKYELNGTCNDEECLWQHERDYLLSELELYEDLSSYMQRKTNAANTSDAKNTNGDKFEKEFEKMKKLVEKEKDSSRIDVQKRKAEMGRVCVERVRKHLQSKGVSVLLELRRRAKPYLKSSNRGETPDKYPLPEVPRNKPIRKPAALCIDDTDRYFFRTSEGVMDLEAAVLERPNDIELWLKLAYKQLTDERNEKNLDKALYALCRGLESNKSSSELWLHYLTLYEQRDSHPDLLQLCQQAVEYAPDYQIWWKYLNLKPSFAEKDTECEKLLEFIQEQQKEEKTAEGSHHLLETLLYRVQLYVTTRRVNQALNLFQDALREYSISSLCRHLLPKDRCLAWLTYLHAMAFHCLPSSLFDPATGTLGRLVCKEPFMFPWQQADSSRLSESLIAGFQDALLSCSSSQLPIEDSIEICLPIYQNLFTLEAKLDRLNKAQSVCRHLVHDCPSSSQLWLCLVDIETRNKCSVENIAKVFQEALEVCPMSAELHYHAAIMELDNDNKDDGMQYLKQCITRYYDMTTNEADNNSHDAINLYRALLNQHLPYNYKAPSLSDGITPEIIQQNLLYLWCCYCLYLEKAGQGEEAVSEGYETGLCALKNTKDVQKLWILYLKHKKSQLTSNGDNAMSSWKAFTDLVNRCLISMATVWPLPHSTTDTWLDFSFHNSVLQLYLSCVRKEDAGDAYEVYLNRMPQNISLAFRACQHAIDVDSEFQAQLICRAVLSHHPTCVPFWKIAVSLCVKNGQIKEAEEMYQRAVEACPLSASLWKDYLLFEVTRGKSRDELKKLIVCCRDDLGLNINDYLETIFKT